MSLKIMVVDDEPQILRVMRSLTVPLGYRVFTIDNSQQATQEAEKQQFDVVFLGMPRQDGFELAGRIQKSNASSESTLVMLSPEDDVETMRRAFASGITFVLPKPIASGRVLPMLAAMDSPGWKSRRHAARLPLFTDVICKRGETDFPLISMNISESGMLMRGAHELEVGQNVSLVFQIVEVRSLLNVRAHIIRKEGTERVAVEFEDLAPADKNAIQLYVMGHLKEPAPSKDSSRIPMAKFYLP
jgi:CheY-like chemotaxis protein